MNRSRFAKLGLIVGLMGLTAFAALAQDGVEQPFIEKGADGLVVSAEMPEGPVAISFSNSTEAPTGPLLARLNADVTQEVFIETLTSQGPFGAIPLVSLLGGFEIAPGQTLEGTFNLQPGTHVVLDISGEVPDVKFFEVADAEGEPAAAPEGDVHVTLMDFAFSLPLQIPAGENVWHLENKGNQWHEMGMLKIDPETSIAELQAQVAAFASGEGESEPPVFFWAPMSQGEEAWVNLDLEPGTYVIACFLPDLASAEGHAHVQEGMIQIITVTA